MSLTYNKEYANRLRKMKNRLKSVKKGDARRNDFCSVLISWSISRENEVLDRIMIDSMNCEILFPGVEDKIYFFKFALERRNLKMIKLLEASDLKIHEVKLVDEKSALHYLAEVIYGMNDLKTLHPKSKTLKVMEYFLENPCKNYCDMHGYTYLHGACMSGNVAAVNLLVSQGVDVNLDSYKYSALHIAAQYRHEEIVEILLENGANPNQPDHEQSTPLHALARLCLCQCANAFIFCDYRRPVDKILKMMVDHGAIIETRNRDGNSPLDLAVSRFDLELTKTLLKHGASLENLNEDKMFSAEFTSTELKNYPLTLNIIEMVQLLQSADYKMSFHSRLRMIKCFMRVRGNDTDHLTPDFTVRPEKMVTALSPIYWNSQIYIVLCIYEGKEVEDFFQETHKKMNSMWPNYFDISTKLSRLLWNEEIPKIQNIVLTDDVSLFELCQMSYSEGYSILKNLNNWRVPPMDDLSHTRINIIIKRHIANIFIRLQLELMVSDLFMTDYCQLNLPYTVCRRITEYMSYEELLAFMRSEK